jgi:hypothetical protein
LVEDVFRERVLQILGWADLLIFLAQTVTKNIDRDAEKIKIIKE